jgi:hypothetical protein
VNWLDDGVRLGGEKPIDQVWAGHGLRLRATVAFELIPNPGEGRRRPIVVEGESDDVPLFQ